METKHLAGVKIHNINKQEFIDEVDSLVKEKTHSYVVTPYSEFIITAQKDEEFRKVIEESAISLPDGFGIALGLKYLSMKGVYIPMIQCLGAALLHRTFFREAIKQKLSGSEIVYDISQLAADRGYKVFLLGGFDFGEGNTGELTKKVLEMKYPGIQIVGTYAGSPSIQEEEDIVQRINDSNAQILYIAYGPVKQEKWAFRNREKLNPMVSFCLGGTFDFVSGAKKQVPKPLRKMGLEGILRPFISERGNPKLMWRRLKRAWGGILKYIAMLMKYKKSHKASA